MLRLPTAPPRYDATHQAQQARAISTEIERINQLNDDITTKVDNLGLFNVMDYGALGDGTTDDTTAIQAAIDAAVTANGIVYLPCGTYKVSSTLVVTNGAGYGCRVVGASLHGTVISHTLSGTTAVFSFTGGSGTFSNVGVEHLTITAATAHTGAAIYLDGQCFGVFRYLVLDQCNYGIWLHNNGVGNFTELNRFQHIDIEDCANGIRMEQGAGDISFKGNRFEDVAINIQASQTGFNLVSGFFYDGVLDLTMWSHATSSVYLNADGDGEKLFGFVTCESFATGQFTGSGRLWWTGGLAYDTVTDATTPTSAWQQVIACDTYWQARNYSTTGYTVAPVPSPNSLLNGAFPSVYRLTATNIESIALHTYDAAGNGVFIGTGAFEVDTPSATLGWFVDSHGDLIKSYHTGGYTLRTSTDVDAVVITDAGQVTVADKLLATTGLGVGNSAAATTPGSVVKKIEVFDASGTSLGFLAVYDAIT